MSAMTARRAKHRMHPCPRLRAFGRLDGWCLVNAGIEAQHMVSVGLTRWTVCYKVHVIPSRRTQFKASITLWPRTRHRPAHPGWHPQLLKAGWYQTCQRELHRYGYRGSWAASPFGRFGDFWKTLRDFNALTKEAHVLEGLRPESLFARGRRTSRLSGPA